MPKQMEKTLKIVVATMIILTSTLLIAEDRWNQADELAAHAVLISQNAQTSKEVYRSIIENDIFDLMDRVADLEEKPNKTEYDESRLRRLKKALRAKEIKLSGVPNTAN